MEDKLVCPVCKKKAKLYIHLDHGDCLVFMCGSCDISLGEIDLSNENIKQLMSLTIYKEYKYDENGNQCGED